MERAAPSGLWKRSGPTATDRTRETRTINLPEDTYRVVVPTQNGYHGSTSEAVTLTK